ncbi:hypothetical protein F3Y22_tig00112261pilonHSYRG00088 [Hibiscus syriacus]|uniref:DUF4218 domain-containing protein n=1 Tax=Hibiscus syriacus TaxID=106335 RepID=A0A6A2Y180_HIBSY|nr:hypothetical protein F3Y22_tig00112261pilonHSYRG00088 [Hibiscus syriacus]
MDKAWISSDRLSDAYEVGVNIFLDFAQSNDPNSDLIRCPCIYCINLWHHSIQTVRYHLFAYGFDESYKVWSFHGERQPKLDSRYPNKSIPPDFDYTRDMLHDDFKDIEKEPDSLKSLLEECEKPLYVGSKYNALSGLLKFQHIKGQFGWYEASFEVLLGPKQPGNNTDVYLVPLIADLKLLWETGVKTYDAYKKEYFNLRAILLWTINDFPAYVMHIEKNVCESVYGTLLNLPGKKKDGLRARQDLEAMGIKPELHTQPRGNRTWLPPACYTLNTMKKHQFYKTLSTIKVHDGYSSNFKNLVSDDVSKINGLLCSKVIDVNKLGKLQSDIVLTLHLLEKYFPPSFFDVMIHLMVHLVREVRLCGPVHFRWMYPFERYMKTLKGYVRNHHRPEGCIAECYVAEEALEFWSDYLKNMKSISNPHERVDERIHTGKPLSWGTVKVVDAKLLDEAHLYDHNPRASQNSKWLQTQHSRTFISWLKTKVDTHFANGEDICESVRWLDKGPSFVVKKYSGFSINEYRFHTISRDESRATQCSGVYLVAHAMQIASAKDSNLVHGAITYYGRIHEIWDLDYRIFTVPIFMCDWVDSRGIKKDDFGFTVVNFARLDHQSERFILASQANQVFYVQDQQDANLSVVGFSPHKMYKYGASGETDDMLEYHVVLGTMESDQSSSHDEDSKQRGPTIKGKTTRVKVLVTYNTKGVPIGIEATKLASFEGMVARSMMQETGKEEDEIDRALLWKKARQMKKGGYDPNVQIVVDKMEEMQKSETLGENYLDGEKKKIEKRFNQIEGEIEKLQKGMNHVSEGASYQGWGKADFEDNPPEELFDTSCYLAIDIASNIAGKGTIVKHNDLSGENIEVMMEMSVQGDALLPFPLDKEFIYKVKDAVGFLVKWPRHLVIRCSDLCPRQSGDTECGYYICKFMKEIVENGLLVLVNKNVGDGKEEYTDDDIDDIRKE